MRTLKVKSLMMVHAIEYVPKREIKIPAFTVSRVIHRLMIRYMISENFTEQAQQCYTLVIHLTKETRNKKKERENRETGTTPTSSSHLNKGNRKRR